MSSGRAGTRGVLLEDRSGAHDARVGTDGSRAASDALDLGGHQRRPSSSATLTRDQVGIRPAEFGRLGCRTLTPFRSARRTKQPASTRPRAISRDTTVTGRRDR